MYFHICGWVNSRLGLTSTLGKARPVACVFLFVFVFVFLCWDVYWQGTFDSKKLYFHLYVFCICGWLKSRLGLSSTLGKARPGLPRPQTPIISNTATAQTHHHHRQDHHQNDQHHHHHCHHHHHHPNYQGPRVIAYKYCHDFGNSQRRFMKPTQSRKSNRHMVFIAEKITMQQFLYCSRILAWSDIISRNNCPFSIIAFLCVISNDDNYIAGDGNYDGRVAPLIESYLSIYQSL